MISSLLHLVGLRPRVYYTLTNFKGGGAGGRQAFLPPPLNTPMQYHSKNIDATPLFHEHVMITSHVQSSVSTVLNYFNTHTYPRQHCNLAYNDQISYLFIVFSQFIVAYNMLRPRIIGCSSNSEFLVYQLPEPHGSCRFTLSLQNTMTTKVTVPITKVTSGAV